MVNKSTLMLHLAKTVYEESNKNKKCEIINELRRAIFFYETSVDSLKLYDVMSKESYVKFFEILGSIKNQLNNWEKSIKNITVKA